EVTYSVTHSFALPESATKTFVEVSCSTYQELAGFDDRSTVSFNAFDRHLTSPLGNADYTSTKRKEQRPVAGIHAPVCSDVFIRDYSCVHVSDKIDSSIDLVIAGDWRTVGLTVHTGL